MPFKIALCAIMLSFFCSLVGAADNETLPMDLMELLGELDDDEDALDQETLDEAMHNIKPQLEVSRQQQNTEAGVSR